MGKSDFFEKKQLFLIVVSIRSIFGGDADKLQGGGRGVFGVVAQVGKSA